MANDRFRRVYGKISDRQNALVHAIKLKAEELESLYDQVEETVSDAHPEQTSDEMFAVRRHKALAITGLEESVMWAVKAATS